MIIGKGSAKDVDEVTDMYYRVTAELEENINYPAWRNGVYPTRETVEDALNAGELYVAREEDRIIGAMVLKHHNEPEFAGHTWQVDATDEEVYSLCTLAIDSAYGRRGAGRAMVEYAVALAKENGVRSVRLDVTQINTPALKIYKGLGFKYIGTFDEGEEYGRIYGERLFDMYERVVE